jgi:hypothetical protein
MENRIELMGLPMELFEKVIHVAFLARELKRGMRLMLVNSECFDCYRESLNDDSA